MSLRTRLGHLYRKLLAPVHFSASRAELHELLRDLPDTPAGWFAMTERYKGRGNFAWISGWQVESELLSMLESARQAKPKVIAEIGTARGATLLPWCRMAQAKVLSIDLEGGIHGGGYLPIRQRLYQEFTWGRPGVQLHLLQENSQSPATVAKAKEFLQNDAIDVLFIDGDHTYQGVKKDFELWSPLVRPGGLIFFHDILPHKTVEHCEVDKLWAELKPRYPHAEFIGDPKQGWAGIGMLTQPGV